jgi:hypothetical protein
MASGVSLRGCLFDVRAAAVAVGLATAIVGCGGGRSTAPLTGVTIQNTTPHFGFAICTSAPLHACTATIPIRHGTRVTPPVDIAAGCLDEAGAAAACPGSSNEPSVQRCYAEHGVIIDAFGVADPSLPTYPSEMRLACDEGITSISFIEPF